MKKTFKMEQLDCANCAAKMEREIAKINGVDEVSISFMAQRVTIAAADDIFAEIVAKAALACRKIEADCRLIY